MQTLFSKFPTLWIELLILRESLLWNSIDDEIKLSSLVIFKKEIHSWDGLTINFLLVIKLVLFFN